jgi:hypothetical protein
VANDIAAIMRQHYPGLRLAALHDDNNWQNADCSCDGFYDTVFGPTIVFLAAVHPRRVRFTILHELAHHLLQHDAVELLEELDRAAGNYGDVQKLEELTCHAFAGRILVPDDLVQRTVNPPVVPAQLVTLVEESTASWEAAAVRLAECLPSAGAVVIMREPDRISFCAPSPAGELRWWPRGAGVKPGGALSRALSIEQQRAQDDEYRYQLGDAAMLYCDTQRVRAGLAIAVLAEQPSRKIAFISPGTRKPSERDTEYWCVPCGGRLAGNWCEACHQRRCIDCDRCSCNPVKINPRCPACFLNNPHHPGSRVCIDCEADGIS